jgi:Protein of unknown function (DUF1631).
MVTDESAEQTENIVEESWIALTGESGRQWAKLLRKDERTGNMLFVGKNGAKMFEMQTDELAENCD